MRGARVVALISADHGGVGGVRVEHDGTDPVAILAGDTVLADGGFQANPAMLHAHVGHFADRAHLGGGRGDTGDALRMSLEFGAKAVGLQYVYGHLLHREALTNDRLWPYPLLDGLIAGTGVLLDRRGARFADEGHGGVAATNTLARSDDPRGAWIVIGEGAFRDAGSVAPFGIPLPVPSPALRDRGATIVKAHHVAELARAIGASSKTLADTLETFNRAVLAGRTADLSMPNTNPSCVALDWPLLAIPVVPGITFTMGGPLIDSHARVLDVDERPIRGLRAAGGSSGGLQGSPRGGYIGGLSPALVLGYLAGEQVAQMDIHGRATSAQTTLLLQRQPDIPIDSARADQQDPK